MNMRWIPVFWGQAVLRRNLESDPSAAKRPERKYQSACHL